MNLVKRIEHIYVLISMHYKSIIISSSTVIIVFTVVIIFIIIIINIV